MSTQPAPLSFREVLKVKALRRLWIGQIVSIFGDFIAIFAVLDIISFQMHGTPTQVSLVLISFLIPFAFISPLAGVFVDRWNTKRTMIASDLIRAALVSLLVIAQNPWQIYAILFAMSTVSTFFVPAQSVAIRTIVPKEGLMTANALIQQVFFVMQILGFAIAGALVKGAGPNICFWLDLASFIVSAIMISTVAINRAPAPTHQQVGSVIHEMNAGAKFIFTHSAISFVVIAISAGMFAVRCFSALVAVYVRDVLRAEAGLFAALSSMVGVGMIIGTQFVHRLGKNRSKAHLVVGGLLGMGIAIAVIAAIPNTPAAIVGMIAMGTCAAFLMVPSQTLLQEETPPNMLGRVLGSMMSVMTASQVAGLTVAGPVAQVIGIRSLYFASAVLLMLIAGAGHLKLRNHIVPQAASESAGA